MDNTEHREPVELRRHQRGVYRHQMTLEAAVVLFVTSLLVSLLLIAMAVYRLYR